MAVRARNPHKRSRLLLFFIVTAVGLSLFHFIFLLQGRGANNYNNSFHDEYRQSKISPEGQVTTRDEIQELRDRFDKMATENRKLAVRLDVIEKFMQTVNSEVRQPRDKSSRLVKQVPPSLPTTDNDWKSQLYVYILSPTLAEEYKDNEERVNCGGCVVLWELEDSLQELGITTISKKFDACPTNEDLAEPISKNQIIVILYTEGLPIRCDDDDDGDHEDHLGNRVHVRWVLAPLHSYDGRMVYNFRNWGEDDLVFHYASSTAVHPDLLPKSSILQVMRNPRPGDGFDDESSTNNPSDRMPPYPRQRGTLVSFRKSKRWHKDGVKHIHLELPEPHKILHGVMTMKVARHFEYFVSYDPYTFQSYAAAMLGAISIVYPLPNLSKKTWAEGTYVGEYLKAMKLNNVPGIAYGFTKEEIEYANQTKGELRTVVS